MTEFLKKIGKSDIRNILAVMITVGCFVLLYLMQVKEIPDKNENIINIAVGFVFGGAFASVCGYYFGASKSDTNKTDSE